MDKKTKKNQDHFRGMATLNFFCLLIWFPMINMPFHQCCVPWGHLPWPPPDQQFCEISHLAWVMNWTIDSATSTATPHSTQTTILRAVMPSSSKNLKAREMVSENKILDATEKTRQLFFFTPTQTLSPLKSSDKTEIPFIFWSNLYPQMNWFHWLGHFYCNSLTVMPSPPPLKT